MTILSYGRRARNVAIVKAILAGFFLLIVVFTLPSPVSLIVSLVDLAFVPVFVRLAQRLPQVAAYALVVETALTPRQRRAWVIHMKPTGTVQGGLFRLTGYIWR
jgi:hypothetical protein